MSLSVGEGNALSVLDWGVFAGTLAGVACLGSFAGRTTVKDGDHGAKSEYVFGTGGKGGFAIMASAIPTMMLSIARGSTGVRAFIAPTMINFSKFGPDSKRMVWGKPGEAFNKINLIATVKHGGGSVLGCGCMSAVGVGNLVFIEGFPSEQFYWGIGMWETVYGMILSFPIVAFVFVPVYYDLGITSVYQYLELRFRSKTVRCLASGTYVIRAIIMLGVTMLTPSVALSGLSGLPLWSCILVIGVLTIGGSVTGGIRGVVIIDALQGILLCATCIFMTAMGCYHAGGFIKAFQMNRDAGRLDFFNFDLDPTLRISTVSAVVGQFLMTTATMGCSQNHMQRYCSMSSKKSVTSALLGNIPLTAVVYTLPWIAGVAMYAALADCDPYAAGKTTRFDGVVTYFINKYFNPFPGLIGFFLAIICNSALNILVSNLNAIGTVIWEDFVSKVPKFSDVKGTKQLFIIRGIAMFSACMIISLAFAMALLPGINEASMMTNSVTSGALLGMFLLAILFPVANGKGAVVGALVGQILTLWVAVGGLAGDTSGFKTKVDPLPTSIAGCNDSIAVGNDSVATTFKLDERIKWNFTTDSMTYDVVSDTHSAVKVQSADFLTKLYAMSYMYYCLFGCVITVVVGLIVSLFIGNPEEDMYEERMVHPKAIKLSRMLPGKQRTFSSLGSTFKKEPTTISNQTEVTTSAETNKNDKELGVVNGGLELDEKLS